MSEIAISFSVLAGVVALFVSNRVPVEVVAVGAALTLFATDVLTLEQSLAGFGDPSVVFIATLFVISESLDATGVTAWAGQQLVPRVGRSRNRLVVLMMLLVALLTAVISVNGAVAALLPMVVVLAVRLGHTPSQLLMPLAFGAHAGSLLALTGTPVNVLVSDAARDATGSGFGYLEFALVGVPLVAGSIAIVVLFGERLLPTRTPASLPPDLSEHGRTLLTGYTIRPDVLRLEVREGSRLVGQVPADIDVSGLTGITPIGVQAGGLGTPDGSSPLEVGDVLIVEGDVDVVRPLAQELGLRLLPRLPSDAAPSLVSRDRGVAEVVIPPRSAAIGTRAFPGMVTSSGDLMVLAVVRKGEDQGAEGTELAAGDVLLLQGTWDALDEQIDVDPDVLVVDHPQLIRRQAVPLGPGARPALVIVGAFVALLATGLVPAAVAGLLAAGALVLSRVLSTEQAYRSVSWTTVLLVGGLLPLSTAMQITGAAEEVAELLVETVGDNGPYALAIGLFLLTAVLGQLISNMATALIVIPIAVSAAVEAGISALPLLMVVNIAAAAALLTPVATPVNMMVMGPAGYRFGDYSKLGLPLMALFFAVAIVLVPVIWSF